MVPKEFINDLIAKVNIVDVINAYVPSLKKKNNNFVACCPFHQEKTPSFNVNPLKQFYYCFGCANGGSVINFLMNFLKIDFIDAIKLLADRVGMEIPIDENNKHNLYKKENVSNLYNTMEVVASYYREQLSKNNIAMEYLKNRGLSNSICNKYQIGYAPKFKNGLLNFLGSRYSKDDLIDCGLIKKTDDIYYEYFRDRIIFPIRNIQNKVIGFGGRTIKSVEPKYLNSPQCKIFDKGNNLYGLYESSRSIQIANKILVVEGYMDVISLSEHGIDYAVATLGTSLTHNQILLLFRQNVPIYFCFDGDNAGYKAAWRALENILEQINDASLVYFLFLDTGNDPDSFVRENGKEKFEEILQNNSITLSEYLFKYIETDLDLSKAECKTLFISRFSNLAAKITKANTFKMILIDKLAKKLKMDRNYINNLLNKNSKAYFDNTSSKGNKVNQLKISSSISKLIRILINNPSFIKHIDIPEYLLLDFETSCFLAVAEHISLLNDTSLTVAQIVESMRDNKYIDYIEKIVYNFSEVEQDPENDIELMFKDRWNYIMKKINNLYIDELKSIAKTRDLYEDEKFVLLNSIK